uniref:ATP synthase F0 subunit 8 n=1 Tax=Neoperla bimaculata TaxID=2908267 RepID=UPI001EE0FE3B|nr:ATP synthase F0 subunit 8 [Neoperla bimaculata]UIF93987.1 ATP synthase F0 subunit 8 [Neoperla bimaculata]
MPQMAPINWFLLFIIFSGTLLMFNFLNYFSFSPVPPSMQHEQKILPKPLTWQW